jgi:hypothetical protein
VASQKELGSVELAESVSDSIQRQKNRILDEWWNGKDLEGSHRGLIDALSRNLPVGTEEIHLSESSQCPDLAPRKWCLRQSARCRRVILTTFRTLSKNILRSCIYLLLAGESI